MKRIYIACPIRKGDIAQNANQAREVFLELANAGFAPFNPAFSIFCNKAVASIPGQCIVRGSAYDDRGLSWDQWMNIDKTWLCCADGVFRIPGESVGADEEVMFAKSMEIPVFYYIEEVNEYFKYFLN